MHIAIIGPPSRLRTELIDLLLHDGHTIHLDDPPSERQAFRSTLVHIGAIEQRVGSEDLTIAIGSEADEADLQILPPSDASIGIIVHDLVDSMTDSPWYAEELDVSRQEALEQADAPRTRWWVDPLDVVRAVRHLLKDPMIRSMRIDIAGRRGWSRLETTDLIRRFSRRAGAGRTGFHADVLESVEELPRPVVVSSTNRPDLGPLNEALERADVDGWQPTRSFRMSVMDLLAGVR